MASGSLFSADFRNKVFVLFSGQCKMYNIAFVLAWFSRNDLISEQKEMNFFNQCFEENSCGLILGKVFKIHGKLLNVKNLNVCLKKWCSEILTFDISYSFTD